MYSTQAYLFQQRTTVLLLDSSGQFFTARYNPVYAKKLTINLGVDNVLLFAFVNQEEKPVNVTGCTFIFRLLSQSGATLLYETAMVILNAQTGQVKVTIPQEDTWALTAQPASYSIQVTSGNLTQAVFTDAMSGARADVDIVNSIRPRFIPSNPVTIPTIKLTAQTSVDGMSAENWPSWAGNPYWDGDGSYWSSFMNTEFYSSFIEPRSALTTIQMDLDQYTGTIKIQAAQNYQSRFYNVTESTTHYAETGTIVKNVVGWHPILRVCYNSSIFSTPEPPGIPAMAYAFCEGGVVTSIIVQNGGSGYLAPPKVSILGDGAGAVARAIMSEVYPLGHPQAGVGYGTIVSIQVIAGGSGYWPIPTGAPNPAGMPVPPANQGAYVAISTGYPVNLYSR